jgi:hypothetical protein
MNFIFFVFASWARNGRFEHFFEKNDLRPVGVIKTPTSYDVWIKEN